MNFAITRIELVSRIVAVLLAILCFYANFSLNSGTLIFYGCLAVCAILLVRTTKHKYLFLTCIFISSYVLLLYPYFVNNMRIGTFSDLNVSSLFQRTIYLFSVFLCSLLFFLKELPEVPVAHRIPVQDNNLIFYLNLLVMIGIVVFGASGQTVMEAGYGQNKGSFSLAYIYFPFFFLASYLYSGRKKGRLIWILLVALAFIARSLSFGGRMGTISILLVVYLLFFDARISFTTLLVLAIVGFAFFSFWGQFRSNPSLANLSLAEMFDFSIKHKDKYTAMGNNQTDVFYASVRIVTMVDVGMIDAAKRIQSLGLFFLSVVVPYSKLPPLANLSSYRLDTYNSLGGGLIFAYFYTYLSYFGIVLVARYITFLWDLMRTSKRKYVLAYVILVYATINTWLAYHPITMIKLCVWGVVYIYVLDIVGGWLVKKNA
ncbi:MAG: hypothetical protein JNL72_12985 [Flavipsychrobacter sp.]|nr:hypothetical protein [Flavipsychrobacter sp.]